MAFFVRRLKPTEETTLLKLLETSADSPEKYQQIQTILLSHGRLKSGEIARKLSISREKVAGYIRLFNRHGIESCIYDLPTPSKQVKYYRGSYYRAELVRERIQSRKVTRPPAPLENPNHYSQRLLSIDKAVARSITEKFGPHNLNPDREELLRAGFETRPESNLEANYLYIYLDSVRLPGTDYREQGSSGDTFVLAAAGVRNTGERVCLSFAEVTGFENAWFSFLLKLKDRGLRRANLWIIPASGDCEKTLEELFPGQLQGFCCFSLEQSLSRVGDPAFLKALSTSIKEIYHQSTLQNARQKMESLFYYLEETAPDQGGFFAPKRDKVINFYRMPQEHWYFLRSTNYLKTLFLYLKKWAPLLKELDSQEKNVAICYSIASALPPRKLRTKAGLTLELPERF